MEPTLGEAAEECGKAMPPSLPGTRTLCSAQSCINIHSSSLNRMRLSPLHAHLETPAVAQRRASTQLFKVASMWMIRRRQSLLFAVLAWARQEKA